MPSYSSGLIYLFEDLQSEDDMVTFQPYDGPVNVNQEGQRVARPQLQHTTLSANVEPTKAVMENILRQKISDTMHIYDEAQDGELEMCIKFGRLYVVNPPENPVSVAQFTKAQGKKIKGLSVNFSSLTTSQASSQPIIDSLNGFEEQSCEEYVSCKVVHSKSPYIFYNVVLEKDFTFKELHPRDRKFLCVDVISADTKNADVRVQVNSSKTFHGASGVSSPGTAYMRDNLLSWDAQTDAPVVSPAFQDKLQYVSVRKETTYALAHPRICHSSFEKNVRVRVQQAIDYDEVRDGRFTQKKARCEVFMYITTKPVIEEVAQSSDFIHGLLSFCYKMHDTVNKQAPESLE